MHVGELAFHAAKVFTGLHEALDPSTAQPVGPKEELLAYAVSVGAATAVMMVLLLLVRSVGVTIAVYGFRFPNWYKDRYGANRLAKKTKSFRDAFVEMTYYTSSLLASLKICWGAAWFWPSGWAHVMYDGRVQMDPSCPPYTIPADLKFLYVMETSYYLASFTLLVLQRLRKETRKDFVEMAAHHVITAGLLSLSFVTGYVRIGAVVMFLHNVFDPFLHAAKLTHYVKFPLLPDVFFASCALTFLVSRLIYYPWAIWHAWFGVCVGNDTCPGGVWDKTPVEYSLIGLLIALIPIHVFWFYLILKVLQKALMSSGVQGDVRSDSEDEDEDQAPPRTKSE